MRNTSSSSIRRIAGALVFGAAAFFVVVATPSVASAATCDVGADYTGTATIAVSPSGPVSPGQDIVITGSGFPPNCDVAVLADGVQVGTATTDSAGSFSFGYTLGASISGTVTIGVSAGDFTRTVTLEVATQPTAAPTTAAPTTAAAAPQASAAPQTAGALPRTGSDSGRMAGIGIALVAAGGLVTLAARRRQAAKAS